MVLEKENAHVGAGWENELVSAIHGYTPSWLGATTLKGFRHSYRSRFLLNEKIVMMLVASLKQIVIVVQEGDGNFHDFGRQQQ